MDVGEHVGAVVDGNDTVAARGERIGEPSDAGAEVNHRASLTHGGAKPLEVRFGGERQVDLDR